MPQIPEYFSQVPVSTESPNALAGEGLARQMSEPNIILSKALEDVKQGFEAIQYDRQNAQDMLDLSTASNALTDTMLQRRINLEETLKKGTDEEGNPINYDKTFQDYQTELDSFIDEIQANPNLRSKVKAGLLLKAGNERQKATLKAYELVDKYQVRDQQETWSDNFNQHLAKGEWGDAIALVNGGFQGRLLTLDQKKSYEKQVFSTSLETNLTRLEAEVGSEKAYKMLADPAMKEELVTIEDATGKTVFRVDDKVYDGFVTDLRVKNNLLKKERKEAETEAYNQVANNVFSLMVNNQITSANVRELNKQIDSRPIKGTQKMDLANKVKSFVENDNPFKETENLPLFNEYMTRALTGDETLTIEEVDKKVGTGGYSVEAGLKIKKEILSPKDTSDNELLKHTRTLFERSIRLTSPFGIPDPNQERNLALAWDNLQQRIEEGKEKGKTLNEMLSSKIDQNGNQVNQNYIVDEVLQRFMPKSRVNLGVQPFKPAAPINKIEAEGATPKNNWMERAKKLNPSYSEKELSDYYDQNNKVKK